MSDETEVISISSGSVASVNCPDFHEGFYVQHEDPEVKVELGSTWVSVFVMRHVYKLFIYGY